MRRRYCRQWVGVSCKVNEGLPGHPLHRPLIHWYCANGGVDGKGVSVPVKDPPLEASVALIDADLRHCCEQALAESAAAKLRPHVEVLQVQPMHPEPRGEVKEVDRESDEGTGLGVVVHDEGVNRGGRPEEGRVELRRCRYYLDREPLGLAKIYSNMRNYLLVWPFRHAQR